MRAAVLGQAGVRRLTVVDNAETVETGPGLVRVAIRATGVCRTDLSVINGTIAKPTPCILGHEGAGEIVEVGAGVTSVAVGDHVVAIWVAPCGTCQFCLTGQANLCTHVRQSSVGSAPGFRIGGVPAFGLGGLGTFAEMVVVPEQAVVRIPEDVPWDVASLLGCGVTCGVGAVVNGAQVKPGSSVVVFGCGGVGMSIIQGARLVGAAEIVAVDILEEKRESARRFGATHTASPEQLDVVMKEVTCGDGFDYAFEAIGNPATIQAAYAAVRRGGTTCVIGIGRPDQMVELSALDFYAGGKRLIGAVYGSGDVRVDIPKILRLWKVGRIDLEGLITKRTTLDGINDAIDDLINGQVIRTVIHP